MSYSTRLLSFALNLFKVGEMQILCVKTLKVLALRRNGKIVEVKKGVSTISHLSRSAGHGDFASLLDVIIFRIHNELRRSDIHI